MNQAMANLLTRGTRVIIKGDERYKRYRGIIEYRECHHARISTSHHPFPRVNQAIFCIK